MLFSRPLVVVVMAHAWVGRAPARGRADPARGVAEYELEARNARVAQRNQPTTPPAAGGHLLGIERIEGTGPLDACDLPLIKMTGARLCSSLGAQPRPKDRCGASASARSTFGLGSGQADVGCRLDPRMMSVVCLFVDRCIPHPPSASSGLMHTPSQPQRPHYNRQVSVLWPADFLNPVRP